MRLLAPRMLLWIGASNGIGALRSVGSKSKQVYHAKPSQTLTRDFLIWLNVQSGRIQPDEPSDARLDLAMIVPPDAANHVADLVGAFSLCPVAGDLHIFSTPDEFAAYLPLFAAPAEAERLRTESAAPTELDAGAMSCLSDHSSMVLRLGRDRTMQANNFIKQFGPDRQLVALHLIPSRCLLEGEWTDFFRECEQQRPWILFLLLDTSDVLGTSSRKSFPNVLCLDRLGFDFLEQFAVAHLADAFIGTFSHYTLAAVASGHPIAIFDWPCAKVGSVIRGRDEQSFHDTSMNPKMVRLFLDQVSPSQDTEAIVTLS